MKPHPDINVFPLAGDILGLQSTPIDIAYAPNSFSTAECELLVKTTEFDFEPHKIRIVGNCAPHKETKQVRIDQGYDLEPIDEDGTMRPKTLL